MKIEDIRLEPEQVQRICDELVSQPNGLVLNDFLQEKFNTATDKAIKKIVEFISSNNSGNRFYYRSGEPGYGTSHLRLNYEAWQYLKELVGDKR